MKSIENEDELKLYELNSQIELMEELIIKIERRLKESGDLMYLSSETALKITHRDFLTTHNQLLSSKSKLIKSIYERIQKEKSILFPESGTAPKFTIEQIDWICYQIGEWYLEVKPLLEGQHNLGYMKEKLKMMICPVRMKE